MPRLRPRRARALLVSLVCGAALSGCERAAPLALQEHDCGGATDDAIAGQAVANAQRALAAEGRWLIPPETLLAGDAQDVGYESAPPYNEGANCSGGAAPGALVLRDALIASFPQIESIGIYSCRVIAGTNNMSLHGVGRALDIMIPTIGDDEADNGAGDPIGKWLIENAAAIGVQTIIWDHTIWRVTYDPREHQMSGGNPHVDHLHVELSPDGGDATLLFYEDPTGPAPPACAPLPSAGGVVDEEGPCFTLHGPAATWRAEVGAGFGGSLLWTNAFESDTPSNWAAWRVPVSATGRYRVEVYLDPAHARFPFTRYVVDSDSGDEAVIIDLGAASGWTALGTYAFSADASPRVAVVDAHPSPVGDARRIAVDALRLVRLDPADDAPPDGSDDPSAEGSTDGPVLDDDEPLEPDEDPRGPPAATGCSAAATTGTPGSLVALLVALACASRRRTGSDL